VDRPDSGLPDGGDPDGGDPSPTDRGVFSGSLANADELRDAFDETDPIEPVIANFAASPGSERLEAELDDLQPDRVAPLARRTDQLLHIHADRRGGRERRHRHVLQPGRHVRDRRKRSDRTPRSLRAGASLSALHEQRREAVSRLDLQRARALSPGWFVFDYLKADDFQDRFDMLAANDFRLVDRSVTLDTQDVPRFNGLFRPDTIDDWFSFGIRTEQMQLGAEFSTHAFGFDR